MTCRLVWILSRPILWTNVCLFVCQARCPQSAPARVFETRRAALQRHFGATAQIERHTVFLTESQRKAVRDSSQAPLIYSRVTYYTATRNDSTLGRAYLDTHRVRSMSETLFIVIDNSGHIASIDVLAFHEPEDYLPPKRWFKKLAGWKLSRRLRPGDGVDAISGATLSVRAACAATRRALGLDQVIRGEHP